jgi:surface protein
MSDSTSETIIDNAIIHKNNEVFDIIPLRYNDSLDTTTIQNIVFIDDDVAEHQQFVDGCNVNTIPIVYNYCSDRNELKAMLSRKFSSIQRIAFVFHNANMNDKLFLNNEWFFTGSDLENGVPSENMQILVDIIEEFQVKYIDYLACNSLNDSQWVTYYGILQSKTNVIVGASNNETGNIKYGGDWLMENTNEDIKDIYFNEKIDEYEYTLIPKVGAAAIKAGYGAGNYVIATANRANTISITQIPTTAKVGDTHTLTVTTNSSVAITVSVSNLYGAVNASISGNTVTVKIVRAGTETVTVSQVIGDGYAAGVATAVVSVTGPATFGDFTIQSVKYGDAPFQLTAPTTDNKTGGFTYTSSDSTVASVTSGGFVTINRAGSTIITVTQQSASYYTTTSKTATLTVAQISPSLGTLTISSVKFRDPSFQITAPTTDNKTGGFTYTSSDSTVASVTSGGFVTINNAGSTTITVTQASSGNYSEGTQSATLTVAQISPSLGTFTIQSVKFGDAPFQLTAPSSLNNTGAFTYTSSDSTVASVTSGGFVTIVKTGSTTITVTQASSRNYLGGTQSATLTVTQGNPTITFNPITVTYLDSPYTLPSSSSGSNPYSNNPGSFIQYTSSDPTVASISGYTVTILKAGTTTITATQASSANYLGGSQTGTFTVNKKQAIISGNFSIPNKNLGDVFSLTSTNTSVITNTLTTNNPETQIVYTSSDTRIATIDANNNITILGPGTCTITASQSLTANYLAAVSYIQYPPTNLTGYTTIISNQTYGNGTYVTSASVERNGSGTSAYAFNDSSSFWQINPYPTTTTTVVSGTTYTGEWTQILLPTSIIVTQYSFVTGASNNPIEWVIAGSTNGSTWNFLDYKKYSSITWFTPYTYTIQNSTTYNYYRFIYIGSNDLYPALSSLKFYTTGTSPPQTTLNVNSMAIGVTTGANQTITIPLSSTSGTVSAMINWGSGIPITTNTLSYTYPAAGTYSIYIHTTTQNLTLGSATTNWASPAAITQCTSFGNLNLVSLANAFRQCRNLTIVPSSIPSSVTSLNSMFSGSDSIIPTTINDVNITKWNTSNVVDMGGMFLYATAFDQNISTWDTSKVTNMRNMFNGAYVFKQNIGNWNTSNVVDMRSMFALASAFNANIAYNQITGAWNTSKVTNMSNMFNGATAFTQNIGNWNTSAVIDMTGMFNNATIFNQNIGNWNISAVIDMTNMFNGATAFNQNIGNWNISAVIDMTNMFNGATAFNQNIGNWNTSAVTNMTNMFNSATAFNQNIGNWNTSAVIDMTGMFQSATAFNQNINIWDTSKVTNMSNMFYNASSFNKNINTISYIVGIRWNVSNVTNMNNMFYGATQFNQNIGNWDTTKVTDMSNMFYNATAFNQNIGNWNISNVTNMSGFLTGNSVMTVDNFSRTLTGWINGKTVRSSIRLDAATLKYSSGLAAYTTLTNTTNRWTITAASTTNVVPTFSTNLSGNTILNNTYNKTYGVDTTFVLYPPASNNTTGTFTYSSSDPSLCTITSGTSSTTVTIVGAGSAVITASQASSVIGTTTYAAHTAIAVINVAALQTYFAINAANTPVSIPLSNTTGLKVIWGDGTTDSLNTHTYSTIGAYNASIGSSATGLTLGSATNNWTTPDTVRQCFSYGNLNLVSLANAFNGCSNLSLVPNTYPSTLTSIGPSTFLNCSSLPLIDISTNVTNIKIIDNNSFQNCSILSNVSISTSITNIGTSAFQNCRSLSTIIIPSSVNNIGASAFQSTGLTSVTLNAAVTSINDFLFSDSSLNTITFPTSVTTIGNSALKNNRLTSVTIPSSVTSIGTYAFYNNLLTPVTAPTQTTITNIDYAAFYNNTASPLTGTTDVTGITYSLSPTADASGNYTASVSSYTGSANVIIPFSVVSNNITYNVTSISQNAFLNDSINTININMNITFIGNYACASNNLVSVIVPNMVSSIGNYAFANNRLTSVNIPSKLTSLSDYVYTNNNIAQITIPSRITSIGNGVFQINNLSSVTYQSPVSVISNYLFASNRLTSFTLPTNTTSIGNYAFYNNLLSSVDLNSSNVVSIGNYAYAINNLTQLILPSRITSIGTNAFQTNRLTNVTISANINSINDFVFADNQLNTILIPSTVTSVGNSSFKNCTGLTSVTIPSSVTTIGNSAFQNCNSLPSVIIPTSVINIETSAFYDCTKLVYMTLHGSVRNTINSFLSNNAAISVSQTASNYTDSSNIIYSISNDQATVVGYNGTSSVSVPLPININFNGIYYPITSIADNVFSGKALTSTVIPPFTNSIGNNSFTNNAITSINLPPGLTSIGTGCFQNNRIISVYFPQGLVSISNNVFQNNILGSITISPSTTTIGNNAFSNNTIRTLNDSANIILPNTITSIGSGAFLNNSLLSLNLPINTDFKSISDSAFSSNSINAINIPSQITYIGQSAFSSCNATSLIFDPSISILTIDNNAFISNNFPTVIFPANLLSIGNSAFSRGNLTSIIIPRNITTIGNSAFQYNKLTNVLFDSSSSLTVLNTSVFSDNSLNSVSIPSSIISIGGNAFTNNKLTNVSIPSSVTSIGTYAFFNNLLTYSGAPSLATITTIGYAAFYNNFARVLTSNRDSSNITYGSFGQDTSGNYITQAISYNGFNLTIDIPFSVSNNNQVYNVTSIASNVFQSKTLNGININMNINTIGNNACASNNLTSLILPVSVYSIGSNAFSNNKLSSINIPLQITSIGDYAFSNNKISSSIIIPSSATYVGQYAFQKNSLTSFIINSSILSINDGLLRDNSLNSFTIPPSITSIGNYSFYNNQFTMVDISNINVVSIGNYAYSFNNITQIKLPLSMTSIGTNAFQNNKLTNVSLPSQITRLSDFIFADNSLNTFIMPSAVAIIGNNALQNNSLNSIQIPSSVTYIGESAFQNNNLNTPIILPANLSYIGNNAFSINKLANVVDNSYNALITFSGKNNDATTSLGSNIFTNNGIDNNNKKVYIAYAYGKRWASTTQSLLDTLVPSISSFDVTTSNIETIVEKLSISPIISVNTKIYDQSTLANCSFSLQGVISQDFIYISLTGDAAFANKNAGNNKTVNITNLILDGEKAQNYILSTTSTTLNNGIINPKRITPSLSINSKTYDATTNATFIYTLPTISGDVVDLSGTANFVNTSVGNNKTVNVINLLLTNTDSINYNLEFTTFTGTANINKAYLYFSIPNKIYDGSSTIYNYSLSGLYSQDIQDVSVLGLIYFSSKDVSNNISVITDNINLSGPKYLNYDASYLKNPPYNSSLMPLTGNIIPKPLDISAVIVKTYDRDNSYKKRIDLSGVVPGDNVDLSYTNILYDTITTNAKKVTVSNVRLGGANYRNYSINQTIDISGTITKKPLDISAVFVKVYDGTRTASTNIVDLSGVIPADKNSVSVTYTNAIYASSLAGNNTVTLNGVSLNGSQNFNYSINSSVDVFGSINKKVLDVSASAITKTYDASNIINFTIDLSGTIQGDDIAASGTGNTKSINVDTYNYPEDINFNYSNITLSGLQSNNYIVNTTTRINVNNKAVITKKKLTALGSVQDKVYDSTTTAFVRLFIDSTEIINNDDVTISNTYSANYLTPTTGINKQILVSNIVLFGPAYGNYDVNSSIFLTGAITTKQLDLSNLPIIKTYDGMRNIDVSLILIGLIETDKFTDVSYTTALFDTQYAGNDKQVTISGISLYGDTSSNYSLISNKTVTGSINTKQLGLILQGISKTYDTTNVATINILPTGKISGDTVNVIYSTATFDTKHVGTNKPITISGIKLTGNSVSNYRIVSTATTNASITPYFVDTYVTGYVETKPFKSNFPNDISANVQLFLRLPLLYQSDGINANYGSAIFPNNDPPYDNSNNLPVTVSNLYLTTTKIGTNATDYSFNKTTIILQGRYINFPRQPLNLFISDISITKIYDRTTNISVKFNLKDASNNTPSNVFVIYTLSNFNDKNVGSNKPITIEGISLDGDDSYKYSVDSSYSTTGAITQKRIDVSRNIVSKFYDATNYNNNYQLDLSGVISGDTIYGDGNVNYYSSNPGNKDKVTVSNIFLSGDGINNYLLPYNIIDLSGVIYKKPLTISASKIYDGLNTVYTNDLSLNGVIQNEIVTVDASGQYSQQTPGNTTANLQNARLSGANVNNYDISSNIYDIPAVIYKKQLKLVISKTYDGSRNISSNNVSFDGIVSGDSVGFSGSGTFANIYVGNNIGVNLIGALAGNSQNNYYLTDLSGLSGNIKPRSVYVSVFGIPYNGSNVARIGDFIINNLINSDTKKVSLVKSNQIPTFYYDSSQAGNRYIANASGNLFLTGDLSYNYQLDNTAKIDASINRLVVGFVTNSKTYDNTTTYSLSDIKLSNTVSGDILGFDASNVYISITDVGRGFVYINEVRLNGKSSGNYTTTSNNYKIPTSVIPKPITVSINPKIYDGTNTVYLNDLYLNNTIAIDAVGINTNVIGTYNNIYVGNKNVSLKNITLTGLKSNNYSIVNTQDISGIITKRPVGLTILPRLYDGSLSVYLRDFSLNNIVSIDTNNIYITGTGTYDSKNVGIRTAELIDLSLSGSTVANYDISSIKRVNAVINPLPAVFVINSKIYDSTDNVNISYVYVKNKIKNDVVYLSGYGLYDSSFVGNRIATITNASLNGPDRENYSLNSTFLLDAIITPYPLSIQVNDKIYDGTNIADNLSLTNIEINTIGVYPADIGRVNIGGYLLYINNIAEQDKLIDVSNNLKYVYLTGDSSINYYLFNNIFTNGNINPKPITFIPSVIPKVYDTYTDATVILDISGLVQSDIGKYSAQYDYANYENPYSGISKSIDVKYIYISGLYVQNYTYNTSLSLTGDILKKLITARATVNTKIYDKTITATANYTPSEILNKDIIYINGDASFNDVNVGINKSVIMNNFTLSGPSSDNYEINRNDILIGNGNISPTPLIPYVISISDKTYDKSIKTTGVIGLNGIIDNDIVSANGTFLFRDSDVSTNKNVDITDIYLTGANAGNYTLSKKTLTGTANIYSHILQTLPYTKIYDGTTYVDISSIKITGMLNNEKITLGGTAVLRSPYNGNSIIDITNAYLVGDVSNNYIIQSTQELLGNITKRELYLQISDKTYDKNNNIDISNIIITGIQNNDDIYISSIDATYTNDGNKGHDIKIDISSVVLGGDLSANYDISGISNIYGNILPRQLSVSVTASDKYIDGFTATTATIQITGGQSSGDELYVVSYDANFETPDIGDNKPVTVTNIQLNNNNYYVPTLHTTANILYTEKIQTCHPISNSRAGCTVYNKNAPQSLQTHPNLSRSMRYSNYSNKKSHNL